jgi:hypothetical protein
MTTDRIRICIEPSATSVLTPQGSYATHGLSPATGGESLRAIVHADYGGPDVLQSVEIATPVPADDEMLVKVHAASVNPVDWHVMRGSAVSSMTPQRSREDVESGHGTIHNR